MILFALHQAGGAQYVLPLLRRWMEAPPVAWAVIAAGPACRVLATAGVSFTEPEVWREGWADGVITRTKPDLIVASSSIGSALERDLVRAGARRKVPTVQFVDAWGQYRERFEGCGGFQLPSFVLAIDEWGREEMVRGGIPAGRIRLVGQPAWESALDRRAVSPGVPLLVSQPIRKYYGETLGYTEDDFLAVALGALAKILSEDALVEVSRHPEETGGATARDGLRVTEARGHVVTGIEGYGPVIGMFSSVLVHAALAGCQTVSLQPNRQGADRWALSRRGLTVSVTTGPALVTALSEGRSRSHRVRTALEPVLRGSTDRLERFLLEVAR